MTQSNAKAGSGMTAPSPAPTDRALLCENSFFPTMDRRVLTLLVLVDLGLIALHIIAGATFDKIPTLLNIAFDFSLGEFFNYAKWAVIVVLLWRISRRSHNPALMSCAVLFAVMLADDSLQIHERFGEMAVRSDTVGDASWAQGQAIGEILVWGVLALLLLPVVVYGFVKSTRQQWVPALRFLGLIALFALFGGVVDALHQPVANLPFGPQLADLVEDGGEMIVASMIVAHAVALWWATKDGPGDG